MVLNDGRKVVVAIQGCTLNGISSGERLCARPRIFTSRAGSTFNSAEQLRAARYATRREMAQTWQFA